MIYSSAFVFRLTSCYEGFGDYFCDPKQKEAQFDLSAGHLTFSDNSEYVVDNVATLLTSGRMSIDNRKILQNVYNAEEDKHKALRQIQQLAIITPEFHSTGLVRQNDALRPVKSKFNSKTCKPYKAVIHLMLNGGMDSFNLLVPYDEQRYNHYKAVRGAAGMEKNKLLQIDEYGIHHYMPMLKALYDDGQASFIAGIGVMSEPVTKYDYESKTATQLFAHDQSKLER